MISLILLTLTTAMSFYAVTEVKQTALQQKKLQAHYIARSGADLVVKWLTSMDSDQASDFANRSFPVSSAETPFGNGSFTINISDNGDILTVMSTGKVPDTSGFVEDTVSVVLNKASSGGAVDIEYAIFGKSEIDAQNVVGDLGINSSAKAALSFKNKNKGNVDGTIYIPIGADPDEVINNKPDDVPVNHTSFPIYPKLDPASLPDPESIPNKWDSRNYYDGDVYVEGDLKLSGNESIKVVGNIYVTGNVDIQGDKTSLTIEEGSIYVYGTDIKIGSGSLSGNIITRAERVELSGNGGITGVLYAPEAEVIIGNKNKDDDDGKVIGAVIADKVTMHGSKSSVTYDPDLASAVPIIVEDSTVTFEMGYWK
jgi:hypothetical protein